MSCQYSYSDDIVKILKNPTSGSCLTFATWALLSEKARADYLSQLTNYLVGYIDPSQASLKNHHIESVFVVFYAHRLRKKLAKLFAVVDADPGALLSRDRHEYLYSYLATVDPTVVTRAEAEGLVAALRVIYPEMEYTTRQVLDYAVWYIETQSRFVDNGVHTLAMLTDNDTVVHTYTPIKASVT